MADTGKQSPLGVNVLGSLLRGHDVNNPNTTTFYINPVAESYYGKSKNNADYEPGKIVNDTCLKWLTYALAAAWDKTDMALGSGNGLITPQTYDAMLNIGQSRIAALGNSKPPTYQIDDPSNFWDQSGGPANSGLSIAGNIDHGQDASWDPWDSGDPAGTNPNSEVTKWGWVRAMALQAYNEFYWNAKVSGLDVVDNNPSYKDFTSSFLSADSFIDYSNKAIIAVENAKTFLQGAYSNQNDLISADIAGVSLSARAFGQDLINLGKTLDLSKISTFGLPSNLLIYLNKNNAITTNLNLALLASGLSISDITQIISGTTKSTKEQEQKIYGAYLVIKGSDLIEILNTLSCKTIGLETLADVLSVKKLFPISYRTLTVPIYNTNPGPTNSKTYYLLFINDELNPQLIVPAIKEQVGTIIPIGEPPIVVQLPSNAEIQQIVEALPVVVSVPPSITASGGGGSFTRTGGGGGGCVALESFIPLVETEKKHNGREITKAWMLESGMKISLGTEELQIVDGSVVNTLNDYQPCVRIITGDGITLVCSTTAPILTKDEGFIPATEVYGKRVAVMRNGITWYDEVIGLEDAGMKFVRVIDAGNNSFWAGERPGSFILHHNVPIESDRLDYDKK